MHATRVLQAAKPNITGFSIEAFRAATKKPKYDPWARREAWTHEGMFTRRKRFANTLPGLAIGTGAFVVYCGYEYLFLKDGHHGHDDSHGHGHGEKH